MRPHTWSERATIALILGVYAVELVVFGGAITGLLVVLNNTL